MALLRKIGRSRLVKLPDGRKQVIDRFEVRSDAGDPANLSTVFLAWGTAHEKYTDCLLVQQPNLDFSGDQRVEQDLVRVYEELHATNETQVGLYRASLDENGRHVFDADFIQLSSATFTEGTVGTTATINSVTCALSRVSHANNGAIRNITRTYNQIPSVAATAEAVGPIVISYPFNNVGDATHVIASQEFEQLASYYAPLALGTTATVTVGNASQTLYYIGDVVTSRQGATLVRFKRQYCNKPASRDEYETYAATFPGIGASQAEFEADLKVKIRNGFTKVVLSKVTYTYYRIAASGGDATSPTGITLDTVQTYTKSGALATQMSPTQIYLSDVDTLALIALGGAILTRLLTVPTRAQYEALGSYGLVLQSNLQRYKGNFYVRITRRVTAI